MTLIELFTDYVRNKKSLKEYVEKRKYINTRGEFNNKALIQAEDTLQKLKQQDPKIYQLMYETLEEYYKLDDGYTIEYPIDFIRQILRMYQYDNSPQKIYECYKKGLVHHHRDA